MNVHSQVPLNRGKCSPCVIQYNLILSAYFSTGKKLRVQDVRQILQTLLHPLHAPPHPLRHKAVPLPVLRQEVPPEV